MIELKYLDSYKAERIVRYLDFDEFMLAFSGCVTIPDNLKVLSLTYNGKEPVSYTHLDVYKRQV